MSIIRNYVRSLWENPKLRWFFWGIGQNGYQPSFGDIIRRGICNFFIFGTYICLIIVVALNGVRTPVFVAIKSISSILNINEMLWVAYGTVFGIAGSLVFQVLTNPDESILSRIRVCFLYVLYFALFFLILNLLLYLIIILPSH